MLNAASPQSLSSAGAPVGMPGGEPEMFVRCSDPDIICETKNMVLVMLRHLSVLCVLLLWVVLSANALHPQSCPIYQPMAVKSCQR